MPSLHATFIRTSLLGAILKAHTSLQTAIAASAATSPPFPEPAPPPPWPCTDRYSPALLAGYVDTYYRFTIHLRKHLRAGEIALWGHSPSFPDPAAVKSYTPESRSDLALLVAKGRKHESLQALWREYDALVAVPAPELWAWALITGERVDGYDWLIDGLRKRHGFGPEDDLLRLGGIESVGEVVRDEEEEKEREKTWKVYWGAADAADGEWWTHE
ncbi:hypothetical protein EDC01DRAFT_633570 [Geopyxis carbonaria]|nr:hypothetical protein EDC01DRAFT_633570 [Geopyxis carbonaria]